MENSGGITLTQAAYAGRLTIKFGTIFLVTLMVGRFFLNAAVGFWKATFPPAPPPPTVGFGLLPAMSFPPQTSTDKPKSYQLETANGALPKFSDRAKVFLLTKSSPSLLADQRAKETAAKLGFVFPPTVLDDRTYRWTRTSPLQATLEMDIQNLNFSITTNYLSRADLLTSQSVPNQQAAVAVVKGFVTAAQTLDRDIATSSGKVTYLKSLGGELSPAASVSDADFAQVDIMRVPVDGKYQFYSPEGTKGTIHAILASGLQSRDQVVHVENHYQPADYTEPQTYPLRNVQLAWQVLQAGEGYIASKGDLETAVIRDVYLGYYDDFVEEEYLQPIYVFEGDGGFLGFVPAIDSKYIQKTTAE